MDNLSNTNIQLNFSFTNATFVTADGIYENVSFVAENDNRESVDLLGCFLVPGFIDTHIHGFGQYNFESPDCNFKQAGQELKKLGTTVFMPTICPIENGRIKDYSKSIFPENFAGFHLEGPFINPDMRGGFGLDQIIPYSDEMAKRIFDSFGGKAKIMTAAPEMVDTSLAEIAEQHGCILSAGHTNASFKQMKFSHVTHLFNAMSHHHHRLPSIWDSALLDDNIACEIIGDLNHVSKQSLLLALKCKPPNGLITITDSICTSGSLELCVRDGLVYHGDTIYGSQCNMAQVFKNLIELGLTLQQAVRLTSQNASDFFGISTNCFIVLNQDYVPVSIY